MTLKKQLESFEACPEAVEWVEDRDLETAWKECERGDWMLWLARRCDVDLRRLTGAKARCARIAQHLMKDERLLNALDVADRFARGEATREELDVSSDAAAYAAAAASAAASTDTSAAYAACAAYYAASYAADAAAAYCAAYSVADEIKNILKKTADICREEIPLELIEVGINRAEGLE